MGHRHVDPRLERDRVARADLVAERGERRVRAHERVRAVVDDVARRRVGERIRTAAEERPALEQRDARAGPDQPHRRREAGEAAADHDHVPRRAHAMR